MAMPRKETVEERATLLGKEGGEWTVLKRLGAGAFGDVYWIVTKKTWQHNFPGCGEPRIQAAMKVSDVNDKTKQLNHELQALEEISAHAKPGFPELLDFGKAQYSTLDPGSGMFNWVAIELIGCSFEKFTGERLMTINCSLEVVKQLLQRIAEMHKMGYVHRDLKPANCGIGLVPKQRIVYLLDFGMCKQLKDQTGAARTGKEIWRGIKRGTLDFMPLGPHNGYETVPLDEVESWFYTAIKLVTDRLPWESFTRLRPPNEKVVVSMKQQFWANEYFARNTVLRGCPKQFLEIWKDISKMTNFEKKHLKPDYELIVKHLETAQRKYRPQLDWERPKGKKSKKKSQVSNKPDMSASSREIL